MQAAKAQARLLVFCVCVFNVSPTIDERAEDNCYDWCGKGLRIAAGIILVQNDDGPLTLG